MDTLAFAPFIDLPLASVTLAMFIWHCNQWALRRDIDTTVDVASRLPTARLRIISIFACFLLLCWWLNLAFWSVLAFTLGIGIAVTALFGAGIESSAFGILAVAYLIREWAFGFPQLILHPRSQDAQCAERRDAPGLLVGKMGFTTSPLRPIGEADIEGEKHSVVSFDGGFLESGTTVTVKSYRSGYPCVAPLHNRD